MADPHDAPAHLRLSGSGNDNAPPPHEVMERAASWYALLVSGEARPADWKGWQAWLSAHPDHRRAWQYVESVSQRVLSPLHGAADAKLLATNVGNAQSRARARRRLLLGLGVTAGAGMLGWAARPQGPLEGIAATLGADYRSGIGDIREFNLPDGSRAWLNTRTALDVAMGGELRRLTLAYGEILVATAHGDPRPFVVDTPQGRMQALGTRYTVRREAGQTFLAVYEGAVEIRTAGHGGTRVVAAGWQTRFDADHIASQSPADIARQAWARGELVAWDLSVAQVIQELGRYYAGHISLAADVAQRRVFGTFPLRDLDGALAMLAQAASLHVRRPLPFWISVADRPAASPPA